MTTLNQPDLVDEKEVIEAVQTVAPKLTRDLEAMMAEETKGNVLANLPQ